MISLVNVFVNFLPEIRQSPTNFIETDRGNININYVVGVGVIGINGVRYWQQNKTIGRLIMIIAMSVGGGMKRGT